MKNLEIKMLLALIVAVITIAYLASRISNKVNTEIKLSKNKYEKFIGEKYILDKDTLTIIDYSIFEENFTLSNNTKVSYLIVKGCKD